MENEERKLQIVEVLQTEALRNIKRYEPMFSEIQKAVNNISRTIGPHLETIKRLNESIGPMMIDAIKHIEKSRKPIIDNNELCIIPPKREQLTKEDFKEIIEELITEQLTRVGRSALSSGNGYPLPKNAVLERLRMKFVDGHTLRIFYPEMPIKTFDYKDMGFKNGKTRNPDTCWNFLQTIAENGGFLTAQNYERRFSRNVKYKTSMRLKKFLNIQADPFYKYNKKDGYRPIFAILKETDIATIDN